MKFTCEIDMDNAAFADEPVYGFEIARALEQIQYALGHGKRDGNCLDSNGNTVGRWAIT